MNYFLNKNPNKKSSGIAIILCASRSVSQLLIFNLLKGVIP